MTTTPLRQDLPDLDDDRVLDPDTVAAFRRDGFVRVQGLLSAEEVAAYRVVVEHAVAEHNREARALADRDAFGKAFLQTQQLRLRDPQVARLAMSRRLAGAAGQLMGVDGVRVFHDQALFKEPVDASMPDNPTPWHQDLYYWPFDDETACGVWLPLVDIEPDMGVLRYATGSHRNGYLGAPISEESQAYYNTWIAEHGIEVVDMTPMRAGDALFHYGWTLHAAKANRSSTLRQAMTVSYFADGMRVGQMTNKEKEHDRQVYLAGRPVGAVADSELNTLLWSSPEATPAAHLSLGQPLPQRLPARSAPAMDEGQA